jgi:type I restriction enzyme, S subunit
MREGLQAYPEYQDSGVDWLGDIPAHWDNLRIKHCAYVKGRVGWHGLSSSDRVKEGSYLVTGTDFRNGMINWEKCFHIPIEKYDEDPYIQLQNGDLLITKDGSIGKLAIVQEMPGKATLNSGIFVVRPLNDAYISKFLYWVLESTVFEDYLVYASIGSTIQHLYQHTFNDFAFQIPPPAEQAAIVAFLDAAEKRFRRYIRAKQKLIKLLNEQKQAIIQQAVTRGLDPNVPMKDSGIEWLGEIPAHWEKKPGKYFYREIDTRSATGQEELLSVSHITGVTPRSQKNITMFKAASYVGSKICEPGDLVINTMWAWMGAMGVSRQTGIVSPSYGVYRPINHDDFLPDFTDYLLRTQPYISEYICRSTGIRSSRLRLYPDEFLSIPIAKPSVEEQQAILDFLENETFIINQYLAHTEQEIDIIREYRTRLIADVVTGKVDVRGVAFEMPEDFDEDNGFLDDSLLDMDADELLEVEE